MKVALGRYLYRYAKIVTSVVVLLLVINFVAVQPNHVLVNKNYVMTINEKLRLRMSLMMIELKVTQRALIFI